MTAIPHPDAPVAAATARPRTLWYTLPMRAFSCWSLLVVLWFTPGARAAAACAAAGETVGVLMRDLDVAAPYREQASAFLQILVDEGARVGAYEVLSTEEVREALDQEAEKALMGCEANSCLAELAEAMDVSLLVSGSVSAAPEGGALVSLFLLNTRAVVVVNRVVMRWQGAPAELAEVVRAAGQTLLLAPEQRPPGRLQLVGLPSGATVFVDGAPLADALGDGRPAGQITGLAIGPHEVRIEAAGYRPALYHVLVRAGANASVNVELEPEAVSMPWLLAGSGGALLAGGLATLAIAYFAGQAHVSVQAALPILSADEFAAAPHGPSSR